jgi:hypothetical protein
LVFKNAKNSPENATFSGLRFFCLTFTGQQ